MVNGPALGQKGVSKEHQLTPIVQMGLFMDGNGIPVCMDLFRGNMSDSDTLKENLDGWVQEGVWHRAYRCRGRQGNELFP